MPLVVRFKRPTDWQTTINIHYWDASPADPQTTWPGIAMTAEANDWFAYAFPTATVASIVFNDGAGRQTGNLRRDADGWFYTNNTWYALNPERPQIPVIRATPRARLYDRPQTVMLESSNDADVIWYTTDVAEPYDRGAGTPGRGRAALPSADYHRKNDNNFGGRGQLGERGRADARLRLHHRSRRRSAAAGDSRESPQRDLCAADRGRLYADRQPTGAGSGLLHSRRQRSSTASPVYARGDAAAGLAGPPLPISASDRPIRFLVVDGAGNETRRSFYYNIGPVEPPRRLPRGNHLLRHYNPFLRW